MAVCKNFKKKKQKEL